MSRQPAPLRAVGKDEQAPAPKPPKGIVEAAKGGQQRELLVAMRDRIAQTVAHPDCPPRDLASLTKRLQDIARDIEQIDARNESGMAERLRELETALAEVSPAHPLILGHVVSDRYDASVI
ncbi:hypothetical protein ABFW09_21450 [Mycolicibacterium fortuitum]|uniref:hypothetical protein n=1 Tax=Mycolicibacterium fortuitum TaxID=1766 RepID=UPI0034CFBEDD